MGQTLSCLPHRLSSEGSRTGFGGGLQGWGGHRKQVIDTPDPEPVRVHFPTPEPTPPPPEKAQRGTSLVAGLGKEPEGPVRPLSIFLLICPSDFSSLLGEMQPSNHSYYMYQQPQGPPSVGAAPPLHTPTSESCQSQGSKQQAGDGYGPPPVMSLHPSAMQHGGYHQHHHPHAHPQQQSQASLNNASFGEFQPRKGLCNMG